MERPRFIDIHAHTNFPDFDADRADVIRRALDAGVWMINVGTGRDTSRGAVELARTYPTGVFAIVGLHPVHASEEDFDPEYYRALAKGSGVRGSGEAGARKVVGIGECGLDYYRSEITEAEKRRQEAAFRAQIELALELDLPLMLHIRSGEGGDAYRDALEILRGYKREAGDRLRGDAHFFAGSLSDAHAFLELGFYLSYTGVVTFAKPYHELVVATPADRIMSETDSPYVAPVPERGTRNEPSFVVHTADRIIGIKGMDLAGGRRQLVENAFRLWRLG